MSIAPLRSLILVCLACAATLWSAHADAHRLRPAVATMTLQDNGQFDVEVVLNIEAILAGIRPIHEDTSDSPNADEYDALRMLEPAELEQRIRENAGDWLRGISIMLDGERAPLELTTVAVPAVGDISRDRLTTLGVSGSVPPGADTMTWQYSADFGASAFRLRRAGEETVRTAFLTDGQLSESFALGEVFEAKSTGEVILEYIGLGFTHILPKGLDHILFVLGIYLLSQHWRPLLYQVTAFTLAHTITLALSLYGVISLSPDIVEPLIALSIVYVAVENIVTPELKPWRVFVVFAFGLLHGMGFAGVLTALGLPQDEYVTALISFNVGVEFGQLAVIALAFLTTGLWFRNKPWYRQAIVIPGSLAIALVGAYWTVERVIG